MPSLATLISFNGTNGAQPYAGLTLDSSGDLFGTTYAGGSNGIGTVFELAKTSVGYAATPTTLISFTGANGELPQAGLVFDGSGNLFGTTSTGGPSNGVGTLFELDKTASGYANTVTSVVSFNGADGSDLRAGLLAGTTGNLAGTTYGGGTNGDGTVFAISNNAGAFTSFTGANGIGPSGSLIADAGGNLIGTTVSGGTNNDGTVFELARSGNVYANVATTLVSFTGANGSAPQGGVIADAAGNLFGTTYAGGANGDGTVFEIIKTASGYATSPTLLASFNNTNGNGPQGALISDAAGDLFGTTYAGGANGDGTVFEIAKTPAGYASTPITLFSFGGANGQNPRAGLVADTSGDLFGTTTGGGANGQGTVFELSNVGFQVVAVGGTLVGLVSAQGPVTPFPNATIADLNANQTETVTVTLSAAANGALSNLGSGTYDATAGVYAVTGTPAAVTTALDGLVFTPTVHQVPAGQTVTTTLTIVATDTAGDIAISSLTGVAYTASASGPLTAATAVSDFAVGGLSTGTQVQDSASNVSTNLNGLQSIAAAGDLGSITLTDGGTPYIALTAAQLASDATALHDVAGSFALSISAAAANVTIAGLDPQDIATFTGNGGQYAIAGTGVGTAFTVTDVSTGRTSVDHLSNIEFVQFADRMMFVATQAESRIALLYQGALGRTPDVAGLVGWQQTFASEPASAQNADIFTALAGTAVGSLPDIAYGFTQSTEFQQKYGSLTNTQFVTQLYANVLDRAPDAGGLAAWVGDLTQGHTREWVLVGFVESQEALQNAELGFVGQSGAHAPWLVVV